ncbi:PAS domain-containing protein, partial [Streptomyces longwoodensis]|uniref:PAS domain-containing protein n=1 Tax=Streptomyces longwoodensis TaxID=68231 RepID=UPI0033BB71CD
MDAPRQRCDPPASAGPHEPFDASSDAAAVVDTAGVVLGWSRAAEALLGRPAAEVVGRPAARLGD